MSSGSSSEDFVVLGSGVEEGQFRRQVYLLIMLMIENAKRLSLPALFYLHVRFKRLVLVGSRAILPQ